MNPWREWSEHAVFVLTSDQDWAPEWAIDRFLSEVRRYDVPLHIFRTNPSAILDAGILDGSIEHGWHPNFLPGSSHGNTIEEVIAYCRRCFPGATTARSHCFAEDTHRWAALAQAGIVADSQLATFCQGHLLPILHWTGILRFPVFFEDDIFFGGRIPSLSLQPVRATLFTPGLKILNFHPTFVACNTPSRKHYESQRNQIFGDTTPLSPYPQRGTLYVFRELMETVLAAGYRFQSFHSLVKQGLKVVQTATEMFPAEARISLTNDGSLL